MVLLCDFCTYCFIILGYGGYDLTKRGLPGGQVIEASDFGWPQPLQKGGPSIGGVEDWPHHVLLLEGLLPISRPLSLCVFFLLVPTIGLRDNGAS